MQENVIKERSETKLAADKLSGNSYLSSPELKMEDTVSTVSVRSSLTAANGNCLFSQLWNVTIVFWMVQMVQGNQNEGQYCNKL